MPITKSVREPARAGQPVVDPANWRGDELAARSDWIVVPTAEQMKDLAAMAATVCKRIDDDPNRLLHLTREDFDPAGAVSLFDATYSLLKDGPGIAFIRGLPLHALRPIEAAAIYWAFGVHLGEPTPNNPQGDMLGHVVNLGKSQSDPKHRGYQTNETMDFHNDQCDVVGLMCLQTGQSGGLSKVVSSVAVYNELVENHPDVVATLSEPLFWTMHGEILPGQKNYYQSPVFNFVNGYLCTAFGPLHIEKGHLLDDVPDLTEQQALAIKTTHQLCEKFHHALIFEPGDIQFLNNAVALHTRTGFTDWPELERRRHLWRLWLKIPDIRPASPYHAHWRQGRGIPIPKDKQRIVLSGFS